MRPDFFKSTNSPQNLLEGNRSCKCEANKAQMEAKFWVLKFMAVTYLLGIIICLQSEIIDFNDNYFTCLVLLCFATYKYLIPSILCSNW